MFINKQYPSTPHVIFKSVRKKNIKIPNQVRLIFHAWHWAADFRIGEEFPSVNEKLLKSKRRYIEL